MASAQLEDWSIHGGAQPHQHQHCLHNQHRKLLASQDNDTADTNETALLFLQ
jgi:hypothetical protein